MIGKALTGLRTPHWAFLCLGLVGTGLFGSPSVLAADCPGHPDAIGTSRTLVVDPREHPRIGTMQYPQTLPLADHEVVLSFDDGPLPRNSNQILDILAANCVKATFFEIGHMAQVYPEGVRKLVEAGHSVGTHSQDHPLTMNHMPIERVRQEVDEGIASVKAALGANDAALAPFFRVPGLLRDDVVEEYLASQGIQIWSADFPADDWRHISSARVYELAMKRLEEKGKGILLLHDIQPRTVAALPRILREMKARGYRIVHVVPATPGNPATPTEPQDWQLHPPSENVAISHWPKIPDFVYADAGALPGLSLADLDWRDERTITLAEDRGKWSGRGAPMPQPAPWPAWWTVPSDSVTALPIPAQGIFGIQEGLRVAMRTGGPRPHHEQVAVAHEPDPVESRHPRHAMRGKHHQGRIRQAARHTKHSIAHVHRGPLKHLVQVRKRRA